jgi:pyridoxamine 5'-phosphate oxidase
MNDPIFKDPVLKDPIARFSEWFAEAKATPAILEPTAMTLATATKDAVPSARIVLLKAHDARGFVFYTNLQSRKSQELKANPKASLCFHWKQLLRQIRIEGDAERVSAAEADAYFAGRPLMSRLGAIASDQSRVLAKREDFLNRIEALQKQYSESTPPPRPDYWSGWRIVPRAIEFWQEGEFRLHDRDMYVRDGQEWKVKKLYP